MFPCTIYSFYTYYLSLDRTHPVVLEKVAGGVTDYALLYRYIIRYINIIERRTINSQNKS